MRYNRKVRSRLGKRQKDYDTTLSGQKGYKRPGSNKKQR